MKNTCLTLFVALFCLGVASPPAAAQTVSRVDAVGFTVADMDRALQFFTTVLPFEKISEVEVAGADYEQLKGTFGIRYRKARLRLGQEEIELTDCLTPGGRAIPEDSRSNDLWFQHIAIVVRDIDSAYARLRRFNVQHVSTAPQTLPKSIPQASGVSAFYFRDPFGHNLELIHFPADKGDPRWQTKSGSLFQGIDHTAIAVSRTEASKQFYGTLLGVTFRGESFNSGEEQAHLNNVAGARLHISGNRALEGPGVEFLEYLYPAGGRPYPPDERMDDLVHWETLMITPDAEAMFRKLKASGAALVSDRVVSLAAGYGYKKGFYVRDPDGHVIGIFEK